MIIEEFEVYLQDSYSSKYVVQNNVNEFVEYAVSKGLIQNTLEARVELEGITKAYVRLQFKIVVTGGKLAGFDLAAECLDHSLQDEPSNVTYDAGSWQSDKVKDADAYKALISDVEKELKDYTENHYTKRGDITLSSPEDVFLALNKVSYSLSAAKENGKWKVWVGIRDTYNFESQSWEQYGDNIGSDAVTVLNNYADYAESIGAINEYNITIYTEDSI